MTGMYAIEVLALSKLFKEIQALSEVALMKTDVPIRSVRLSCGRRSRPAADRLYKKFNE